MNPDSLEKMIQNQIVNRGITDKSVLSALREVDRKDFVPEKYHNQAYEDRPLPLKVGQTISQPYIVALMTEKLNLNPGCNVLEIGTGSGYQTAVLAYLSRSVVSIECIPELYQMAQKSISSYPFRNLTLIQGDGRKGWPDHAPYDRIIVTAAPETLPPALFEQLAEGGKLVAPIGKTGCQTLIELTKKEGKPIEKPICAVRFVPLV